MELQGTSNKLQKACGPQRSHNELAAKGLDTNANLAPDGAYVIKFYVDDYILGVVEDLDTLVRWVARAALYGIHSIFSSPRITGHEGG
jgi:hypothetical protein